MQHNMSSLIHYVYQLRIYDFVNISKFDMHNTSDEKLKKKILTSKLEGRNNLGNLRIDGRIILKRSGNNVQDIYGCREEGDNITDSINGWNLLARCYPLLSDAH